MHHFLDGRVATIILLAEMIYVQHMLKPTVNICLKIVKY